MVYICEDSYKIQRSQYLFWAWLQACQQKYVRQIYHILQPLTLALHFSVRQLFFWVVHVLRLVWKVIFVGYFLFVKQESKIMHNLAKLVITRLAS